MRMDHPYPTFAVLAARVREEFPRLAFLHAVEPRIAGALDRAAIEGESNDFLRAIWKGPDSSKNGSMYITAGGYTPETAIEHAERSDELVVFGRYFISNVRLRLCPSTGLLLRTDNEHFHPSPTFPRGSRRVSLLRLTTGARFIPARRRDSSTIRSRILKLRQSIARAGRHENSKWRCQSIRIVLIVFCHRLSDVTLFIG